MRSRSCDALWRVVRSSLTYAASADSLTPSPEVLRESICACVPIAVATPSLPQSPDLFYQSHVSAGSLDTTEPLPFAHFQTFEDCRRSVELWDEQYGKQSQPAHQTCHLEQICHVKRNREEGTTGVVRGLICFLQSCFVGLQHINS